MRAEPQNPRRLGFWRRGAATAALAAIHEGSKSAVPTLGYGVAYAVGNVLLALWGTVIVALIA
jgi:putative transport protein